VERRVAYAAVAAGKLPEAFTGPLDIVLFHSARAAETFLSLGAPGSDKLIAGCISPVVAKAASETRWGRIVTARAPREDALLDATLGG
jgi:uroporphyrinogen-III synthase